MRLCRSAQAILQVGNRLVLIIKCNLHFAYSGARRALVVSFSISPIYLSSELISFKVERIEGVSPLTDSQCCLPLSLWNQMWEWKYLRIAHIHIWHNKSIYGHMTCTRVRKVPSNDWHHKRLWQWPATCLLSTWNAAVISRKHLVFGCSSQVGWQLWHVLHARSPVSLHISGSAMRSLYERTLLLYPIMFTPPCSLWIEVISIGIKTSGIEASNEVVLNEPRFLMNDP